MKFGVFDHMDRAGADLGRQFDERLRLIELYERAGFHGYHLAEHHATPLGWCCHGSLHGNPLREHAEVARLLLEAGAQTGSDTRDASASVQAVLGS